MPLNFPLNPLVGQTYTQGNFTWTYNGVQWITTVTLGYRGSSGEGFQGSVGFKGSIGDTGYQGSFGFQGSFGYQGSPGFQGSFGFQGSYGFQGSPGFQGSLGFTGSLGAPGQANVVFGDTAPDPAYDGLLWLNTNNAVFAAWSTTANAWIGLNGGVQGQTGFTGSIGPSLIPVINRTTTTIAQPSDVGDVISITTGGVVINSNTFANGENFSIFNNSGSNQTITANGITMYLAGTGLTGNRTLSQRGLATAICVSTNTFVITGSGIS